LADEPTGDPNSKSAISMMKLIKILTEKYNQTFIIVTHDPLVVRKCPKVYTLRDGRLKG
jgi:putative ABC transport system ATP-binding protein